MNGSFFTGKLYYRYRNRLLRFFRNNQPQMVVVTIVTLAFLFVRQTAFFRSFVVVNVRTAVFIIWLLAVVLMDISYRVSFLLAVFTFLVCLLLEAVGVHFRALRLATYAYYFLGVGFLQYLWQLYRARMKSSHD